MQRKHIISVAVSAFTLLFAPVASAGEVAAELGASGHLSSWNGDYGGGARAKLAYRTKWRVGFDVAFAERVSRVDLRQITGLAFGAHVAPRFGSLTPVLGVYFLHQHEQAWVSVAKAPLSTVVGIGSGIRHRAGFGIVLGTEVALTGKGSVHSVRWYLAPQVATEAFPGADAGPHLFVQAMLGVGASYDVLGLP